MRNPLLLLTRVRQGRTGGQQGPQWAVLRAPGSRNSTQARWALLCTSRCTGSRNREEQSAPRNTRWFTRARAIARAHACPLGSSIHLEFLNQKHAFTYMGFPGGSDGKGSACNVGDLGSIPGSGRCPGEGNGNPLQYSGLKNPMDRGVWRATVHGVAKSQT